MAKNLVLNPILAHLAQIQATNFYFENLALSVTRYYGQLSSCTIEKPNYPILRNLDGQVDRWTRVISEDAVRLNIRKAFNKKM